MEIKRKTNILVKTARKLVVRMDETGEHPGCENCAEQMFTAQSAAFFYQISTREIYRLIETGKIRFIETVSKDIYICPNCFDVDLLLS